MPRFGAPAGGLQLVFSQRFIHSIRTRSGAVDRPGKAASVPLWLSRASGKGSSTALFRTIHHVAECNFANVATTREKVFIVFDRENFLKRALVDVRLRRNVP